MVVGPVRKITTLQIKNVSGFRKCPDFGGVASQIAKTEHLSGKLLIFKKS